MSDDRAGRELGYEALYAELQVMWDRGETEQAGQHLLDSFDRIRDTGHVQEFIRSQTFVRIAVMMAGYILDDAAFEAKLRQRNDERYAREQQKEQQQQKEQSNHDRLR